MSGQVLLSPVGGADLARAAGDRARRDDGVRSDLAAALDSLWPSSFAEWFVVAQTAIPALLFVPGSQAVRLPLRVGAYGTALAGLALWWLRGRPRVELHPAAPWLKLCAAWLCVMVTHPLTNSLTGGIAQVTLYAAVFCSVFWAPAHVDRREQVVRLLALLLICNGVNALVGLLQVYDPDRWMPRELSLTFSQNRDTMSTATYMGANGRTIVRPPGLFDSPGAVVGPATTAAVLGLVFAVQALPLWQRGAALALSGVGAAVIYLSHVRANFVVTLATLGLYTAILIVQRQRRRAATFGLLGASVLVAAFVGSSILGGDSIADRFSTLIEEDPRSVYYAARGRQLTESFSSLAEQYPLGAGLARWGLVQAYFGDPSNLDSTPLWAEIQPAAWLIDGGLVFVALYAAAILALLRRHWLLIRGLADADDRQWAAAVVAINVGTIALVFSFVPFTTQVGLQFWFLEGALHGAFGAAVARAS